MKRVSRGMAAFLFCLLLSLGLTTVPTMAFWSDQTVVTSGNFGAYTVPTPVWVSCVANNPLLGSKTVTVTFGTSLGPTGTDNLVYSAIRTPGGESIAVTPSSGSPRQVVFSTGLLSVTLGATYNIVITARLPAPNGTWVSAPLTQEVNVALLGLSLSCGSHSP